MRIQILTLDLEYSNTIKLDGFPWRVQTSETTIGVSCNHEATFFLKILFKNSFKLAVKLIKMIFWVSSF